MEVYVYVWLFACCGCNPGIKPRALIVYILWCDSEKTFRLFMAEEMMLSRINMAKSSYQLHNGQATWLRSEQHHLQRKDVCMCIYSRCVCVCSPSCNLFRIRAGEWVYTPVCVIGIVSMCAYLGSFNQRPIVRRYGGPVSLSFCSDKTAC